jgi:protein-tyrosine phosphatase
VLRAKLAAAGIDDVEVTSSGTGGWHAGDPMDPRAAAVLGRAGYDGSAHRARRFDRSWSPDLVLVMDSGHLAELGGDAQLFAADDVPDPYYGDEAGFDDVLARIEKAADTWVDRLRAPDLPPPRSSG